MDIFYTGRREIAYKLDEYGQEQSVLEKLRREEIEAKHNSQRQRPDKRRDEWER